MIRKKWTGGEAVLSVETEDESHKALPLGLPVLLGEWTHGESPHQNSSVLLCDGPKFSRQRLEQLRRDLLHVPRSRCPQSPLRVRRQEPPEQQTTMRRLVRQQKVQKLNPARHRPTELQLSISRMSENASRAAMLASLIAL